MSHRDHRDEHEGCPVSRPWDRWCSRYRYPSQLVEQALSDILTLSEDDIRIFFDLYKKDHDFWKTRRLARTPYISLLEGWSELERRSATFEVDSLIKVLGEGWLEGQTREYHIERALFRKRQYVAIQYLYAYGMFDMRTGKIKMANLAKLDKTKKMG